MTAGGFGGDRHRKEGSERVRAAQYVRMPTEHQQYSTENQADAIRQCAERRGIEIVRTYADEGRSGLRPTAETRSSSSSTTSRAATPTSR